METEIEEEKPVYPNFEEEKPESRYLTQKKKQYLLASNQESIQQLIQSQMDQLTDILIQHKSEYDKLTRESNIKIEQSELLDKKIKALQGMDSKTKKKAKENKETIQTMKDVINTKNGRKAEENYNKKTLQKQVDKLNQDILLIQKEILQVENKGKVLDKKLEKARLSENNIRQKRNDVNFQVSDQNQKNKFDKNEQALLISYYETIIKQKYMFIQSADERKERQKKIQQDAKNDSQDKQEVEKRNELHLLVLFNQYLREKMSELLKNNEKIEETLDDIRDITGTEDLDLLVDIILLRDKRYNYCVKRVAEEEKKRKELNEELIELNNKYIELKNQVLVQEEEKDDSKTISTIPITHIEDEEKELIEKEKLLNKQLYDLGEKHNLVNLSYSKVLENMKTLKEIDDQDPRNKHDQKEEMYTEKEEIELKNEPKLKKEDNNIQTTNVETEKKEEIVDKNEEKEKEENEEKEEKKEENNEGEKKDGLNEDELLDLQEGGDDQATKIKKDEEKKEEEKKEEEKKEEEKQLEVKEDKLEEEKKEINLTEEEESIIKEYNEFLYQSSRKFDLLFLMHSKQEFIQMMKEIGKENEVEKSYQPIKSMVKRVNKRKTSRLFDTLSRISRASRTDFKLPPVVENRKDEEDEVKSNFDPDKDILKRFMDEQKKERDEFVNVNNEPLKNVKKKITKK